MTKNGAAPPSDEETHRRPMSVDGRATNRDFGSGGGVGAAAVAATVAVAVRTWWIEGEAAPRPRARAVLCGRGGGGRVAAGSASDPTESERSSREPEANESTEERSSSGVSEREFLIHIFGRGLSATRRRSRLGPCERAYGPRADAVGARFPRLKRWVNGTLFPAAGERSVWSREAWRGASRRDCRSARS